MSGSSRFRVGIVVDNPFRDLPGLALLARELVRRGADLFLIPLNRASHDVWAIAPHVLVLNYLRANNQEFARQLHQAGIRIVVLDTEGSVFSQVPQSASVGAGPEGPANEPKPAMEEYALTMARDASVRATVTHYCSWNDVFADYAANAGWYRRDQIVVTGAPRMDFYAERWRSAALAMAPYATKYGDPMVLINGSFPLANPAFQTQERELNMMVESFGYARDYVESWQRSQINALKGISRLANVLARRFPRVQFVFRPHPFEGRFVYRFTLDEELPNLHFEKTGTVDGWILNARAMIHWGSSTAIEAAVAGIPALVADWVPQHLPVPIVDDLSIGSSGADELGDKLEQILSGAFVAPERIRSITEDVVRQTYHAIDGFSYQRVADVVWRVLSDGGTSHLNLEQCRRFAYGVFAGTPFRSRFISWGRMRAGRGVHWSWKRLRLVEPGPLPWDRSEKAFAVENVETIIRSIERQPDSGDTRALVSRPTELSFGYRGGRSIMVRQEGE